MIRHGTFHPMEAVETLLANAGGGGPDAILRTWQELAIFSTTPERKAAARPKRQAKGKGKGKGGDADTHDDEETPPADGDVEEKKYSWPEVGPDRSLLSGSFLYSHCFVP